MLDYWADDFEVVVAGYRIRGCDEMLRFYGFFHQDVKESVRYSAFVSDMWLLAIE